MPEYWGCIEDDKKKNKNLQLEWRFEARTPSELHLIQRINELAATSLQSFVSCVGNQGKKTSVCIKALCKSAYWRKL